MPRAMHHLVRCLSSLDARLTSLEERGTMLDDPMPSRCIGTLRFHRFRDREGRWALRATQRGLGANLDLDTLNEPRSLGKGSDAEVIRVGYPDGRVEAVKLFAIESDLDDPVNIEKNLMSEDLANREFKALSLVKGNPHFPVLISDELDTCSMNDDGVLLWRTWAVRMQLIEDSYKLHQIFRLFGCCFVQGDMAWDMSMFSRAVNCVIMQLMDAVGFLRSKGIRHMDLDVNNVMVHIPSFNVIVIDFARSDTRGGVSRQDFMHSKLVGWREKWGSPGFAVAHPSSDIEVETLYSVVFPDFRGEWQSKAFPTDEVSIFLMMKSLFKSQVRFIERHRNGVLSIVGDGYRGMEQAVEQMGNLARDVKDLTEDPRGESFKVFFDGVREKCGGSCEASGIAPMFAELRDKATWSFLVPERFYRGIGQVCTGEGVWHTISNEEVGGGVKRKKPP